MITAIKNTVKTDSASAIFDKTFVLSVFLFFNFMITFRVLLISLIPEAELIMEAIYELIIFIYLGYRLVHRAQSGNLRFNSLEIYLVLIFFLPFLASYAAMLEFGQPIWYGIGTFRDFYLIFGGLIVYNMLRNNTVSIELVERMFVLTAWANVLLFYFMTLFTNPAQYQDTGLAGANTAKGGDVYYRFNMAFVFFGTIYYFTKAFFRKKPHLMLYGLIFFVYVVFFRFDRTSIAVLVAALVALYATALAPRRQMIWLLGAITPLSAVIILVYFANPGIYSKYYLMFADAFSTLGGSLNAEGEESVRLSELRIAYEYIEKNPWIGNGKVSPRWVEGGYNYFLGYFYQSDIGFVGQIFMYGFLGAALLYFQFALAINYILRIKHIKRNVFLVTLKFFLLALALDTITTGYLTIYAAQSMTPLILIYFFYQKDRILQVKIQAENAAVEKRKSHLTHRNAGITSAPSAQ